MYFVPGPIIMHTQRLPVAICMVLVVALSLDLVDLQETTENALSDEVTTQFDAVPIDSTYLSSVKYYIKEEGFDDVAASLITNNASFYNLSLPDLLEVTEVNDKNFTEISQVLDSFDLASEEVFNFENIESVFDELNISLLAVYRKMISDNFIPDPRINIPLLQEQLGIDKAEFDDTILYGNDSSLFRILRESNFSSENIQKAFAIIGKTPSDFYEFVKPFIFEKLVEYSLPRLVEVSQRQGIQESHVKDLLGAFNVTSSKYQAVPAFKNAFQEFTNLLNNVEIVATRVSSTQLVSVNQVATKWKNVRNVADLYVEPLDDSLIKYKVATTDSHNDDCLYGPIVLRPENYNLLIGDVEIAQDYETHHMTDCKYVTVIDNTFVEEDIPTAHNNKLNIISDFANATLFKVGSPLFCLGKLYGIAEELKGNEIGFRTFYCDPEIFDTTTIFSESSTGALRTENYRMLITVLGLLNVFRLIH